MVLGMLMLRTSRAAARAGSHCEFPHDSNVCVHGRAGGGGCRQMDMGRMGAEDVKNVNRSFFEYACRLQYSAESRFAV